MTLMVSDCLGWARGIISPHPNTQCGLPRVTNGKSPWRRDPFAIKLQDLRHQIGHTRHVYESFWRPRGSFHATCDTLTQSRIVVLVCRSCRRNLVTLNRSYPGPILFDQQRDWQRFCLSPVCSLQQTQVGTEWSESPTSWNCRQTAENQSPKRKLSFGTCRNAFHLTAARGMMLASHGATFSKMVGRIRRTNAAPLCVINQPHRGLWVESLSPGD